MFLRYVNGSGTCLDAEHKCDKCDAIYLDSQPHTCNTNAYYSDIVTIGIHRIKPRGIVVIVYELRIARSGNRIRGKAHKGVTLATVTSGSGIPQWMERAKQAINHDSPETELAAQMIASIEKERKQ
jgi:hypothetical protein